MKRPAPLEESSVEGVQQLFKRFCLSDIPEQMAVEKTKLSLNSFVEALMTDNLTLVEGCLQLEEGVNTMIPLMECFDVMSPLMIAAFSGSVHVCDYLISQGADPLQKSGARDLNAIQIAYLHEKNSVLEFFKYIGLNIQAHLPDLLIKEVMKAKKADIKILKKLIVDMEPASLPDTERRTLFMHALTHDYDAGLVSILVKLMMHADQHLFDNYYILLETINWLKRNQYPRNQFVLKDIFAPLCARFTDIINVKNQEGESLLYTCAYESMIDCCQVLVDNGAFEKLFDPEILIPDERNALCLLPRDMAADLYDSMLSYKIRIRYQQFFLGKFDENSVVSILCGDLFHKIAGIVTELREMDGTVYVRNFEGFDEFKVLYLSQYLPQELAEYIVRLQYPNMQ